MNTQAPTRKERCWKLPVSFLQEPNRSCLVFCASHMQIQGTNHQVFLILLVWLRNHFPIFYGAGTRTQGLVHARQALITRAISSAFLSWGNRVSLMPQLVSNLCLSIPNSWDYRHKPLHSIPLSFLKCIKTLKNWRQSEFKFLLMIQDKH